MDNRNAVWRHVDARKDRLIALADRVWAMPEVCYTEARSCAEHVAELRHQGFRVTEQVAGIPTAVMGEAGEGGPVIAFLGEYENSATRHAALVSDTKFLGQVQRELVVNRQRDVVAAFTRFIKRAYPERVTPTNQTALTMMLFGMINWTFIWLRPGGPMSYAGFAEEVVAVLEGGLAGRRPE